VGARSGQGRRVICLAIGFGTTLGGIHFGLASTTRVFVPINDSVRPNRFSKSARAVLTRSTSMTERSVTLAQPTARPAERTCEQCGNFYGLIAAALVDSAVVTFGVDGKLRIFDAASGSLHG
jgi:hypothetical protein